MVLPNCFSCSSSSFLLLKTDTISRPTRSVISLTVFSSSYLFSSFFYFFTGSFTSFTSLYPLSKYNLSNASLTLIPSAYGNFSFKIERISIFLQPFSSFSLFSSKTLATTWLIYSAVAFLPIPHFYLNSSTLSSPPTFSASFRFSMM